MVEQKRHFRDYLLLYTKGLGMGASDIVPGVSGGTIAFITGIYEELINSLRSINFKNFKLIFTDGLGAFWKAINGSFLIVLLLGILTSIFTLAKGVQYMLDYHPIIIWSFFFGLILVSALSVLRTITKVTMPVFIAFGVGTVSAYLITVLTPMQSPETLWFVFICGIIAICAMILPGISGSFILVLMGAYVYILNAVTELNILVLAVFACGAVIGLISFSHVLSWLFRKYHNITIALLAGFMLGSLNKVWPWKIADSDNPVISKNLLPSDYATQTGIDAQLLWAVGMAIVAIILYWGLEAIAKKVETKKAKNIKKPVA